MTRRQLDSFVLAPALSLLTLLFTLPAQADNRVFLSTSLEDSQASYVLEFSTTTGGTVDKFRLTFPTGTLGPSVGLVNLLIGDKAAKTPVVTSIDPLNPNALLLDVPKTVKIKPGVQLILELMGLTNPVAGDYQIGIDLIGKTGSVLETLTPIPLSIAAPAGTGTGDITAVIAGTGLSGGGTEGDVTLTVDTAQIQKRVTGTCAAGNAIQSIDATGNVACQSAGGGTGGITGVNAGAGLSGGGPSGDVTLSIANGGVTNPMLAGNSVNSSNIVDGSIGAVDVNTAQIQARVAGTCAAGNAIRVVAQDGTVTCESTTGASSGSGWGLAGNSGTNPATNFLGTSDGQPLIIQPSIVSAATGVGIGTKNPTANSLQVGNPTQGANYVQDAPSGWRDAYRIFRSGAQAASIGLDSTGSNLQFFTGSSSDDATARLTITGNGDALFSGGVSIGSFGEITVDSSTNQFPFFVPGGRFKVAQNGNVGIGTNSPTHRLTVEASGITEETIRSTDERAILSLDSTINGQNHIWTLENGVFGTAGLFSIFDRTALQPRLTIDANGMVAVKVLQITGGSDLSEQFEVKGSTGKQIQPGMVVAIDPENPGKLTLSSRAYDRKVAGIMSGAGGVNPGMLMGQSGSVADGQYPVALTGRVYAWADASNGSIKPGDLLTSSKTPGHAMKVTDHTKAQGAIIGKAMTALNKGKGLVLVLVSLQ